MRDNLSDLPINGCQPSACGERSSAGDDLSDRPVIQVVVLVLPLAVLLQWSKVPTMRRIESTLGKTPTASVRRLISRLSRSIGLVLQILTCRLSGRKDRRELSIRPRSSVGRPWETDSSIPRRSCPIGVEPRLVAERRKQCEPGFRSPLARLGGCEPGDDARSALGNVATKWPACAEWQPPIFDGDRRLPKARCEAHGAAVSGGNRSRTFPLSCSRFRIPAPRDGLGR